MASRNVLRVASRIKFIVGSVLQHELRDPRLGFVTVLDVEPTEDFKEARVYFSVLGSEADRSKTLQALEAARGFIQKRIAQNMRLRNTPTLRFVLEERQDPAQRIEELLDQAREEEGRGNGEGKGKGEGEGVGEAADP